MGLAMVRAVSLVYIAAVLLRVGLAVMHVHAEKEWQHGDMAREAIVRELNAMPGEHLVLVDYAPDFDPEREWVYNGADIDGLQRSCGRGIWEGKQNRELLDYYPARRIWRGGSRRCGSDCNRMESRDKFDRRWAERLRTATNFSGWDARSGAPGNQKAAFLKQRGGAPLPGLAFFLGNFSMSAT